MAKLKHEKLRQAVIETCLAMNEEGINQGTSGNVSVRVPQGFLITASGVPYKKMKPHHIVLMDVGGGYHGDYLPSTEWRMHMDIYRARAEAKAIVHVHSPYATALAALRLEIPAFHYMIGIGGGTSLRVSDYAEFGTQELSNTMLKALEGRSACLLANHGQIVFGNDEFAVIAPFFWIANFRSEFSQFGERFFFGICAHPRQGFYALFVCFVVCFQ